MNDDASIPIFGEKKAGEEYRWRPGAYAVMRIPRAVEADHEVVWMTVEEAVGKLNHGSQAWEVGRAAGEQRTKTA